jgi:hypothetical protein
MKTIRKMFWAVIALVIGLPCLTSTLAAADAPTKVGAQYVDALKKNDLAKAISLSARFTKLAEEEMERLTSKVAAALKGKPMTILAEPSKILEDCAVVIGKQSEMDLDPVYLLKQGGQWRVLPTITRYDHQSFELSEVQQARFLQLKTWFKEMKAENYKKVNGAK